jgi:hypothetical protein
MIYRRTAWALTALVAGLAHAEEGIDFKFSGFGTLGAVVTNTDEAQYRASLRQGKGADTSADFGVDSRLGLQANVNFNQMFSAVGQVLVSRRDGQDGPQLEWLFGQARLASWADVRLGRMVLPAFMLSDTRNVGFASHWIHAPHESYATYPPTSFDGVQASFRTEWQGFKLSAQPSYGKTESKLFFGLPGKSTLEYDSITALALTAEYGDWLLRYGVVGGRKPTLTNSVMTISAGGNMDRFTDLGVQYDNGSLLFLAQYTTRRQSSGVFDSNGLYASLGYRIDNWTPYITAAKFENKGAAYDNHADDSTYSAGVRWDFMKNVALKYQYDATTPSFHFVNGSDAFKAANARVNVHSVALDFVF